MPSWPSTPPSYGAVVLRAFTDDDVPLAVELGADPYVELIGTLVARHRPAVGTTSWPPAEYDGSSPPRPDRATVPTTDR